jgi:peptidoglycan/LPS O-acetylase OafA/YrhL
VDSLDGLRAFAFAGVFLVHLGWAIPNGGLGVNVFFTLSGFLITSILLGERERATRINLPRFYLRRGLRLMPALLVVVVVSAAYAKLLRHAQILKHETLHGVVPALFYYSNWTRAFNGHIGMLVHTWSLAVEEQFYLIWPPLLVAAYALGGRRGVLILATAGAAASLTLRIALWHGLQSQARVYNGSDTSADQLLIGCALAVAVTQYGAAIRRIAKWLAWPAVCGLLAIAVSSAAGRSLFTWGYTLVSLAAAVIIAQFVTDSRALLSRCLSLRPFVFTGRISYGLYLWHYRLSSWSAHAFRHSLAEPSS